jgi:hypothetical protein
MKIPGHLRALKPGMAEALGHYVYLYVDPRDDKVFYVWSGPVNMLSARMPEPSLKLHLLNI